MGKCFDRSLVIFFDARLGVGLVHKSGRKKTPMGVLAILVHLLERPERTIGDYMSTMKKRRPRMFSRSWVNDRLWPIKATFSGDLDLPAIAGSRLVSSE